jgi:hypothetical protein
MAIRRQQLERQRALDSATQHLHQMLFNLRSLAFINERHNLQLDLPREDQLIGAIKQCARIDQLDKEQKR